jgi:competence protein ComEA
MNAMRRIAASCLALAIAAGPAFAAGVPKALPVGKLNINTASTADFLLLPGVGPKLAARIVAYRQKAGGFKTTRQLMNVRGVGEKSFARLSPYLTAGEKPAAGMLPVR